MNTGVHRVFPTPVGVNRILHGARLRGLRIPHTRGGEPELTVSEAQLLMYSPHPWG